MSDTPARLQKPLMRGILAHSTRKHMYVAIVLSLISGIAMKYGVCDARKKRYADFYKNYDAEADFQRMKDLGLFQSG